MAKKFQKQNSWTPIIYTTARVKESAPVFGAGEFVKVLGHLNEKLYLIRFIDGTVKRYHKAHLERFVI